MDRVGRLLLAVLLIAASSCTVQAKLTRYSTQFYETVAVTDTPVLQPLVSDPIQNKGYGWAKHNSAIHTTRGAELGSVGGIYFFHSKDAIEDIVTITFSRNLTGIWNGSSLNVRGLWRMNADGTADLDEQELSIVGGQGGLRGASGSVYYKRVQSQPTNIFLVTCDIYVDELKNRMRKSYVDLGTQFNSRT